MSSPGSFFIISVNEKECVDCGICEIVCSLHKERKINPSRSRIKVRRLGSHRDLPLLCRQCRDAPCREACPADAVSRTPENIIAVDPDRCTGCGLCVEVCPFDAIFLHPETDVACTCDMCGGDPVCIRYCPTACISYMPYEDSLEKKLGSEKALYESLLEGVEL
jgi:carbon-monoxide dehydrogenase iron sulfur subunit